MTNLLAINTMLEKC